MNKEEGKKWMFLKKSSKILEKYYIINHNKKGGIRGVDMFVERYIHPSTTNHL
jgi:hypothetical protein